MMSLENTKMLTRPRSSRLWRLLHILLCAVGLVLLSLRAGAEEPTKLTFIGANGSLRLDQAATTDTFTVYFHVPIAFEDQAPFLLELSCPELVSYRYISYPGNNFLIAAEIRSTPSTEIYWESWMVIGENNHRDLPTDIPMASLTDIPDQVKGWLTASDCVQSNNDYIQGKARTVAAGTFNLRDLASNVATLTGNIPGKFPYPPWSFDAYYALAWGNSCTGKANAGAALMRANGVPSRILMSMPTFFRPLFDMHWIAQYWLPNHGWVRMETSMGQSVSPSQDEVILFAFNPEDEFLVFASCGAANMWHTSEPALAKTMYRLPDWGQAHQVLPPKDIPADAGRIRRIIDLAGRVFTAETECRGASLNDAQSSSLTRATMAQKAALSSVRMNDLATMEMNLETAFFEYGQIRPWPTAVIFADDFEASPSSWVSGGSEDTWELGTPTRGPGAAHSGVNCWSPGLSKPYASNADNWLLSPPIDLTGLASATLSFWIYNWVPDGLFGAVAHPTWLDITTDGRNFKPLCDDMGGVNDHKSIPAVGG